MYSCDDHWFFISVVSQFGNLRIVAYLQLPAAYRSLSRPSSAPDAKAFTLCSLLLELLSLCFLAWVSHNLFYNEKAFLCAFRFGFSAWFFIMRPNCSVTTIFRKTFNYFLISIFSLILLNYLFVFSYLVFNEHSFLQFPLCVFDLSQIHISVLFSFVPYSRVFLFFPSPLLQSFLPSLSACFDFSVQPSLMAADTVGWWAQVESNHRPHAYQACALTFWAMSPYC